ncbi:hypothetical protein PQQ65_33880 [Paraburkholderia strydomiana]|jgi:hypothetical protein|uniref:hypothetical protein n=1 Tax=Paraburkholderia strydomiana TaxID=1245417 RepID=UPI0038B9FA2B
MFRTGVWYQLNLLADADLVRSMGSDWRLTWDGHEFLKSVVPQCLRRHLKGDLSAGNIFRLS